MYMYFVQKDEVIKINVLQYSIVEQKIFKICQIWRKDEF